MRILNTIRRTINRLFGYNCRHPSPRRKRPRTRYIHVNSINRLMLGMVNKERRKHHLPPVVFDHSLEMHSVIWSQHMAGEGALSHSETQLENCCMVTSDGSPTIITKRMFHQWKKSSKHWAWMMDASVKKAAFAYAKRGKFAYGAFSFE